MEKLSDQKQLNVRISAGLHSRMSSAREQTEMSWPEFLSAMLDRWNAPRDSMKPQSQTKNPLAWAGPAGANRPAKLDPASAGAGVVGDFAHLANLDELANENHVRAQMNEPPRTPQESGLEVQEQIEEEELEALRESLDRKIEDGAAADARNARPRKTGPASTRAAPASEELPADSPPQTFEEF